MPIKPVNISPESSILVTLGDQNIMDTFFLNSQDSLGMIDSCELYKEPITSDLIQEIMLTSVPDESEEFSRYNEGIKFIQMNATSTTVCPPTGTIPSQEDYSGPYGFELHLTTSQNNRGNYVYSELLKQVFIGMNNILMIEFKTTIQPDPGFYIRSLLMYTNDDFICEPVVRCASHFLDDDPKQEAHVRGEEHICKCSFYKNAGHVMRCSLIDAEYCYNEKSDRHSVRIPLKKLQPGTDFFQIPYSFSCKSSCPRGMQRKPVQIVFTLESESGEVYGRKVLAIKICSCPKRDKDRQERDFRKSIQPSCPSGSKRFATPPNLTEVSQPPAKSIKVEENGFDDSQNEEEKQQKHKKSNTLGNPMDDYYQRLMTKMINMENNMKLIREHDERLQRVEKLLKEQNGTLNELRDLFKNRV